MNAFMGSIGVSNFEGILSPAYAVARPIHVLDTTYYHYLFRTPLYMIEFDRRSYGIMHERNRLYFDRFKAIPVPVPPIEEQRKIAVFVEQSSAKTDKAIEMLRHQIALLREYLVRLVSDVVTGKLDVREAIQRLPQEAPEAERLDELDDLSQGE